MKTIPFLRGPACVAVFLAFLALSRGQAQTVPAFINFQGQLSNPDGSALPTADYTLTFNLFDAATNGTLVWGPQVFDGTAAAGHGARIPVVLGYFNVILGPMDTTSRALSDAFNGAARYVEITVSNRPPIAPRQQILTTPFAFQAANAATVSTVGGQTAANVASATVAANAATNTNLGSTIVKRDGAGNFSAGTITANLAGNATTANSFSGSLSGDVTGGQGTTVVSSVGGQSAASVASGAAAANAAASANLGSAIVKRDASGNFSAGTITATAFNGDGSGLYNLNAINLTSGTVSDARLSPNVELLSASQTVTGARAYNGPVSVSGNLGIGTSSPQIALHVHGAEVHSSGANAGLSFNDRAQGAVFATSPTSGQRWEWFSQDGVARLWSNADKLTVDPGGVVAASGGYKCRNPVANMFGNVLNYFWTGTRIDAYIDTTFVGALQFASDRRLKEDIHGVETGALQRVMQLRPVSFKYKNIPDSIFSGSPDLHEGFIADEVQKVIPSAVTGEKDELTADGKIQPQTISVLPVVSVMTRAVQEQQYIIEAQKRRIDSLEARLADLERLVRPDRETH